ncbi:hypothetical protein FM110_07655 [Brachybacterium nesterenkovii]|uniref:Uncharacterized protein n=1 Tax=Brachybacterium nesterenkovii TaxID=47847 RepID=A0A1X6X129_9MICO|nr:hypothetical protein FM110_07655 [Brachybacterium nesterenkovii]
MGHLRLHPTLFRFRLSGRPSHIRGSAPRRAGAAPLQWHATVAVEHHRDDLPRSPLAARCGASGPT